MTSSSFPPFKSGFIGPPSLPKTTQERLVYPETGKVVITGNILGQLAQVTSSPVFAAAVPTEEGKPDEIMEKLLKNGFIIEYRMYENDTISYFIAFTRRGDKFLILIDDEDYKETFPQISPEDLQLQQLQGTTLIPQETRMGALQCLIYDICGAAFVCNDNVCVIERDLQGEVQQTTFVLQAHPEAGLLGNAAVALPIMKLSFVLKNPLETEKQVTIVSEELYQTSFNRLSARHQEFKQSVDTLRERVDAIAKFAQSSRTSLKDEIDKLIEALERMMEKSPDSLPDEDQRIYYQILRNLRQRKVLRNKIANTINTAYVAIDRVNAIIKDLDNLFNPVLQEVTSIEGKAID